MLTMPMFDYLTFLCPQPELQAIIKTHGLEGWRLHTSDAVATYGPHGSGILQVFVVMDKIIDEPQEQIVLEDGAPEGIAMSNPRT